MLENLKETKTH
jgi:hypothetical protein